MIPTSLYVIRGSDTFGIQAPMIVVRQAFLVVLENLHPFEIPVLLVEIDNFAQEG